jgi:hypothetical protein
MLIGMKAKSLKIRKGNLNSGPVFETGSPEYKATVPATGLKIHGSSSVTSNPSSGHPVDDSVATIEVLRMILLHTELQSSRE